MDGHLRGTYEIKRSNTPNLSVSYMLAEQVFNFTLPTPKDLFENTNIPRKDRPTLGISVTTKSFPLRPEEGFRVAQGTTPLEHSIWETRVTQDCTEDQLWTKGCSAVKDGFWYKGEVQLDYEQVGCPC